MRKYSHITDRDHSFSQAEHHLFSNKISKRHWPAAILSHLPFLTFSAQMLVWSGTPSLNVCPPCTLLLDQMANNVWSWTLDTWINFWWYLLFAWTLSIYWRTWQTWMTSFSLDLASGYHQADMDPKYYTYLEFQWEGEFYVSTESFLLILLLPPGASQKLWEPSLYTCAFGGSGL